MLYYFRKMNNFKTVCEIEVSTNSQNCHYLGSGLFDFTLGQYLDFDENLDIFVGAKDVRWKKKTHSMTFGLKLMKKNPDFDETLIDTHHIEYGSMEEFALMVETCGNRTLEAHPNKHMSLEHTHDRFFLRIHPSLMVVMSHNLAESIDMIDGGRIFHDYVMFDKKCYMSESYIRFMSPESRSFSIVLYDMIREYRIVKNGSRYPVLFDYSGVDTYKCYDLLGVKELVKRAGIRQFKFQIVDREMRPMDVTDDYESRPLEFKLVFLLL